MAAKKRADSLSWEQNVDKILRDCKSSKVYEFKKWLTGKEGIGAPFFDSFYHKRLFNIHQAVNHQDSDHFIVVAGKEGCLTGDTIINVNRCTLGRRYRLDYIYKQYHNNQLAKDKLWDLKHLTYVRSFDGKSIRLHKMKDVIYSGIKEVFYLGLENGRKIKATADHKILTKNGWVELQNLNMTDEVMCDTLKPQRGKQRKYKLKDVSIRVPYHKYKNVRSEVEVHRLIYESYQNKLKFMDYLDILWNDEEKAKELKFIDPSIYHVHHKDGCHYNNAIENLELLKIKDHKLLHGKEEEAFRHFNQGIPVYSKVKLIKYVGKEKTYDIICEEPNHNFVANGIVVHNCGKSTLAIQTAAMLDPTFNINRICFKMCDYIDRLRISKPGQAFILDEGNMFLFNREAYSDDNRFMVKLFALMRQRNLVTIICVPNFFTLDSYVRLHRVDTLIYIHKRGKYLGYVKSAIKTVSKEGQRTCRMAGFKLRDGTYWPGFYNKQLPQINNLSEDLYRQHKGDHFDDFLKEIQAVVRTREKDSEYLTLSSAIKILPLSRATYVGLLKDEELRGKKIGGKWYIERAHLLEMSGSERSGGCILSSKGIESKSQVRIEGKSGAELNKTTKKLPHLQEKTDNNEQIEA